jgi:polysaccharide export outer membrane protein
MEYLEDEKKLKDQSFRTKRPGADYARVETADMAEAENPDIFGTSTVPTAGRGESRAVRVTIQPETILRVSVKEDSSLRGNYKVESDGSIKFGYAGVMFLDNLTVTQAEGQIKKSLEAKYLRSATVNVEIIEASYDKIKVSGSVASPGIQKIGPGDRISLHTALLRAGGVELPARRAEVRVIRGGLGNPMSLSELGEQFSLVDETGEPRVPEVMLTNLDQVYVIERQAGGVKGGAKRILMLGETNRRGYIQFASGEPATMMHLMFKVGGFPRYANSKKIQVVRKDDDGNKHRFIVNAEKPLKDGDPEDDFVLQDGDIVIVPPRTLWW